MSPDGADVGRTGQELPVHVPSAKRFVAPSGTMRSATDALPPPMSSPPQERFFSSAFAPSRVTPQMPLPAVVVRSRKVPATTGAVVVVVEPGTVVVVVVVAPPP